MSRLVLLGTPVAVAADDPVLAERIARLLEPFATASSGPTGRTYTIAVGADGTWSLSGDDGTEVAGDRATIEAHLLAALSAGVLEQYDGFAVHAGVVAARGEALCFPAASGVGKSTLTAACVAAGFRYVSDEALCVDPATGHVVPFPRPIALSAASRELLGLASSAADVEVAFSAVELGGVVQTGPVPLGHVFHLRRGPSPVRLEPLDRVAAVAPLLALSFNHYKRPAVSVELVGALARGARAWRLHYGDAPEAAELLWTRFGC